MEILAVEFKMTEIDAGVRLMAGHAHGAVVQYDEKKIMLVVDGIGQW